MRLINRWVLAATAANRWRAGMNGSMWADRAERERVQQALDALGANPGPEVVNRAVGNDRMTAVPECDECGKASDDVVQMGTDLDYAPFFCPSCLLKAMQLVNP
jgi:hypothetical protein